ncbi:hypothetical protein GCM10020367_41230 [Streptomyces sannanensis]|uniref:Uncharacterized protein n=1 Tax=Streptomyces sannanensis TaxID=285536 RepID=A0ABP6SER0_9ACTN
MASSSRFTAASWIDFGAARTASTARPWSPTTACAASYSRPVTVLTSDPEDLTLLCGPSVEVVKV